MTVITVSYFTVHDTPVSSFCRPFAELAEVDFQKTLTLNPNPKPQS